MSPIALTIAGSDSGGGAGIQADLKTFSALGVYGASALTALTAQNTQGVQALFDVAPDFVAAQIDSVLSDLAVSAIKIGMAARSAVIVAIGEALAAVPALPCVVDPVMVAQSGDRLLQAEAVAALKSRLIARATLVTPNLPEAAALLETREAASLDEMAAQARAILSLGPQAVLIKGGHGAGAESIDLLVNETGIREFSAPRLATRNTHGTGCTLSAAIAAELAKGAALVEAVGTAKRYVHAAIAAADRLNVGHGHGPTHHFHAWW